MSISILEIKKFFQENNIPEDTEIIFKGSAADRENYYSRISKIYIEKFYKTKWEGDEEYIYRSITEDELDVQDIEKRYDFSDFKIKVVLYCDCDTVYDYHELDIPKIGDNLNYSDYKNCVLEFLLKFGKGHTGKGASPLYILDQIGGKINCLLKTLKELCNETEIHRSDIRSTPYYIATAYLK